LRDRQAERLGGLQIDDELESCRLLDRQIGGPGASQDFGDIAGRESSVLGEIGSVAEQPTDPGTLDTPEDRRQPVRDGKSKIRDCSVPDNIGSFWISKASLDDGH
jgi:hypothetical protein